MRLSAKEHLSLLYVPRKGRKGNKKSKAQKTLQEDALQAYFYCRLTDRLAGRVLDEGTHIILNRESLATKDQRLDIKVQAPTIDGSIATVVIELKWSSNPGISTSLCQQLVEEYLDGLGLTHGIYLVGWSVPGTWRDKTTAGPTDRNSSDAWLTCLAAQASSLGKLRPELCVVPLVIDLAWPQSHKAKKDRSRRKGSRRTALSNSKKTTVRKKGQP